MGKPPVSKDKPKSELDAFKELLSKLLAVPKSKLDEKRRDYDKQKQPGSKKTEESSQQ